MVARMHNKIAPLKAYVAFSAEGIDRFNPSVAHVLTAKHNKILFLISVFCKLSVYIQLYTLMEKSMLEKGRLEIVP